MSLWWEAYARKTEFPSFGCCTTNCLNKRCGNCTWFTFWSFCRFQWELKLGCCRNLESWCPLDDRNCCRCCWVCRVDHLLGLACRAHKYVSLEIAHWGYPTDECSIQPIVLWDLFRIMKSIHEEFFFFEAFVKLRSVGCQVKQVTVIASNVKKTMC